MAFYLLLAVVMFSGYLSGLKKEKRFYLWKSLLVVGGNTIVASLSFWVIVLLITHTPMKVFFLSGPNSLFVLVLLIAVLNGIFLYWLNRVTFPKTGINNSIQTFCEYIIQWGLIYITIYQVIFDNLSNVLHSIGEKVNLEKLNLTNPSDLVLLVLPSLISVWMSIILYKVKENNI